MKQQSFLLGFLFSTTTTTTITTTTIITTKAFARAFSASTSTTTRTTTAAAAAAGKGSWSESAIQQAQALSISQRAKLLAEPGVVKPRAVHIKGERVTTITTTSRDSLENNNSNNNDNNIIATKIVHFQRHGQGYHNLFGDILRDAGITPNVDSTDPSVNPWLRPEIVDSPLTETGKEQCREARQKYFPKETKTLSSSSQIEINPQLIVVSPLLRAIQTAEITFADFFPTTTTTTNSSTKGPKIPWIAHEKCREELGVLVCNKRRPLSEIQKDYPQLEYFEMYDEEDTLWNPTIRESNESKSDRIYDFLVHFIANRPESEMAVIGHSAWLFHMCNAVIDCTDGSSNNNYDDDDDDDNSELQSWFLTSEIRSIQLVFTKVAEEADEGELSK